MLILYYADNWISLTFWRVENFFVLLMFPGSNILWAGQGHRMSCKRSTEAGGPGYTFNFKIRKIRKVAEWILRYFLNLHESASLWRMELGGFCIPHGDQSVMSCGWYGLVDRCTSQKSLWKKEKEKGEGRSVPDSCWVSFPLGRAQDSPGYSLHPTDTRIRVPHRFWGNFMEGEVGSDAPVAAPPLCPHLVSGSHKGLVFPGKARCPLAGERGNKGERGRKTEWGPGRPRGGRAKWWRRGRGQAARRCRGSKRKGWGWEPRGADPEMHHQPLPCVILYIFKPFSCLWSHFACHSHSV